MAKGYKLTGTNTVLDVVKKAHEAEAYRDSVNTEYRKLINLLTVPPTEVYKEHKKMAGDVKEAELDIFHNLDPTKNLKDEKSIVDALSVFGEKSKDADEIIAHTLEEFLHTQRGEGMDILTKASTKSGEDRFIHQWLGTVGDIDERNELREWYANMLRNRVEGDPTFAATLSYKEGMEKLAPQEGLMKRFAKMLGF